MNWAELKQNKPLRYTALVTAAGLMATFITWHTFTQWTAFQTLDQASAEWASFSANALRKVKETEDKETRIANLRLVQGSIETIYNGQTELPCSLDVTKVLLQKCKADIATTLELVGSNAAEEEMAAEIAVATSSIQSLAIHYQELTKEQLLWAERISLIAILILLVLTIGAAVFVFRFFRQIFDSHNKTDKKFREEEARVAKLTQFIEAMSSGQYDIQLKSDGEDDDLTQSLVAMRDKLIVNAEEDKRRNWATTGQAKIGEILRSSGSSTALYDSIISFVVKYTHSNQGGLFLYDDDESTDTLHLAACYAFERKKFLTKRVDISQGLVGQCFLEKEIIYMTNVPQDYIQITSGLGGENPGACLLVPLKVNDEVYGVIELASFKPYQHHEIELVEKFAESIASTISTVRINESTKLLLERTQQQAEEMKSQEEEMRQNMEELSATQEEMQRKEVEYINRIQELEGQLMAVEKE